MDIAMRVNNLREQASNNAAGIFKFWTSDLIVDRVNGGFYGRVTKDMEVIKDEPRALVLNGRMVYAFSKAYLTLGDQIYLDRARHGFDFMVKHFLDGEHGGAFNTVGPAGEILDDSKPLYGEAFMVLAAAAYHHASRDAEAKRIALELFQLIEQKAKIAPGVYKSSFSREWQEIEWSFGGRPSPFPPGAILFQHHLCQAYEMLYRATGDKAVGDALSGIANFITDHLYDSERRCFKGAMDAQHNRLGAHQSYGHDCEISYLAWDIANLVGDAELIAKMKYVCTQVLEEVVSNDIDSFGSMYNGVNLDSGKRDDTRIWWAQAECATAMLCGYELTRDEKYVTACENMLDYIDMYFVDRTNGDWFNNVRVDGNGYEVVDGMHGTDKLNSGKCPFHNSHMCFDIMERSAKILSEV